MGDVARCNTIEWSCKGDVARCNTIAWPCEGEVAHCEITACSGTGDDPGATGDFLR